MIEIGDHDAGSPAAAVSLTAVNTASPSTPRPSHDNDRYSLAVQAGTAA